MSGITSLHPLIHIKHDLVNDPGRTNEHHTKIVFDQLTIMDLNCPPSPLLPYISVYNIY